MLEHYFWLLEFKFKFEFHCLNPFLNPFSKLAKPSHLSLSPPFLSGPRFACGPSAGSPPVPLFLFSGGHARQPSSQLRKPSPAQRLASVAARSRAPRAAQQPPILAGLPAQAAASPLPAFARRVPLTFGAQGSSPTARRPQAGLRRRLSPSEARLLSVVRTPKSPPPGYLSAPPPLDALPETSEP
jgi:hypothetical protein